MFPNGDVQSTGGKRMRGAILLYAAGSISAGIFDLIWGEFEAAHQPIQALGDRIPGRAVLAYIAAIWLIGGGAAILWRRFAREGATALAAIYLIFAGFWLPRFYSAIHVQHGVVIEHILVPGEISLERIVQDGSNPSRREHGYFARIAVPLQEMISVEVDQANTDAIQDPANVRIPFREHVIAVLHETPVFDLSACLSAKAVRLFKEHDFPSPQRQFAGNYYAGESTADDNGRMLRHFDHSTTTSAV